jgi:hypothetical protein
MVRAYRKAQEFRDKRKNQEKWIQGMYVYESILEVAPILHAFAKKGTKPEPYSKEPYPITEADVREREEREARLRQERIKAEFAAFADRMRKKMPKEAHPDLKGGENNERSNND